MTRCHCLENMRGHPQHKCRVPLEILPIDLIQSIEVIAGIVILWLIACGCDCG